MPDFGNQNWKLRKTHGAPTKYDCPKKLWGKCVKYFEWCKANPVPEDKSSIHNGKLVPHTVAHDRATTIEGLTVFLGISRPTWTTYGKREDLADVVESVNAIMDEQKLAGAIAGTMNHAIVARYLGLADKKELDGSLVFDMSKMSDAELEDIASGSE